MGKIIYGVIFKANKQKYFLFLNIVGDIGIKVGLTLALLVTCFNLDKISLKTVFSVNEIVYSASVLLLVNND